MALPQKETPDVQRSVGMARKSYAPVDASPLGRGVSSLGEWGRAIEKSRNAEDVHLVVNQGLREMQEVQAHFENLKGEQGASLEEYDKAQARLERIWRKRLSDAKTEDGRIEVSRALDAHRTNVTGRMFASYLGRRDAQFAAESQAQLDSISSTVSATSDHAVIAQQLDAARAVASRGARFRNLSDAEAAALDRGVAAGVLKAAIDGVAARNTFEDPTYEEARALLDHFRDAYGDVLGTAPGDDGVPGKGNAAADHLEATVENLRVRKTADEVALDVQTSRGVQWLSTALLNPSLLSKSDRAYVDSLLADNRLTRPQLLAASQQMRDRYFDQNRLRNDADLDRAWEFFFDEGFEWLADDVQQIYERLKKRAKGGDGLAERHARTMAMWWGQAADAERSGRDRPNDAQWFEFFNLTYNLRTDPRYSTSSDGNRAAIYQRFRDGRLHYSQWQPVISLYGSIVPEAVQRSAQTASWAYETGLLSTQPLKDAAYRDHGTKPGKDPQLDQLFASADKEYKLRLDAEAQAHGGVVPPEMLRAIQVDYQKRLFPETVALKRTGILGIKSGPEYPQPSTPSFAAFDDRGFADFVRRKPFYGRDGGFVGFSALDSAVMSDADMQSDEEARASYYALGIEASGVPEEKFRSSHPELFAPTSPKRAGAKERMRRFAEALNRLHAGDPSWSRLPTAPDPFALRLGEQTRAADLMRRQFAAYNGGTPLEEAIRIK